MDDKLIRTRLRLDPRQFQASANANRTPGLHVTDVLRDIDGMLGKVYKNDLTEDDLNDMALQGYLWEWAMTETLRDRVIATGGAAIGEPEYFRLHEIAIALDWSRAFFIDPELPAELRTMLTRGCLIISPDGGVIRPELKAGRALLECKFCYKGAPEDPAKEGAANGVKLTRLQQAKRIWFQQAKIYLFGWSLVVQEFIGDVEWHVQFPVGEYWGDAAVYERWQRRYEQPEISATAAMVRGQIDYRLSEKGGSDPFGWRKWL